MKEERKDHAENTCERTGLAQEPAGGDFKFRWAEKLPLTVLSARSEEEMAKHLSPSTLLVDEITYKEFLPSPQAFN